MAVVVLGYLASCVKSETCQECLVRDGCPFCLADCLIPMDYDCRECVIHRCPNCFGQCTVSFGTLNPQFCVLSLTACLFSRLSGQGLPQGVHNLVQEGEVQVLQVVVEALAERNSFSSCSEDSDLIAIRTQLLVI